MSDTSELLELYKYLVMYCGDPGFYLDYNAKLRKSFSTKQFAELLTPFTKLAILNKKLGFNEHVIAYRGVEFRNKPYSKSERDNKKLDMFRNAFPYNSHFPDILKELTSTGKKNINQLLSTTRDMDFALRMSDVEYFKYPDRNPYTALKQTHMYMVCHIFKKTHQINVPELYKYFKKHFSFAELKLDKAIIKNFTLHVVDAKIDEIIIVPNVLNNEQYITNHVETADAFLSRKTLFKPLQKRILENYYKQYKTKDILDRSSKDNEMIIYDSYFINMKF